MCMFCDGYDLDDWLFFVDAKVQGEPGWFVSGVEEEPGSLPWRYTIGLLENFDHPELVMVGLESGCAYEGLNRLGRRIRDGERFTDESRTKIGDVPVSFLLVDPDQFETADTFNSWTGYYDARGWEPVRMALQVLVDPCPEHGPGPTHAVHLDTAQDVIARHPGLGPNRDQRRADERRRRKRGR